jgi:hypothetical protein
VPFDEFLAGELHLLDGIRPEQLGDERIWQRVLEFNQDPAAWEPPAVPIEVVEISGPHGGIPVRLYGRREAATALLWLHGGGFLAGDLDMPAAHVVATELAARRTPSSPRSTTASPGRDALPGLARRRARRLAVAARRVRAADAGRARKNTASYVPQFTAYPAEAVCALPQPIHVCPVRGLLVGHAGIEPGGWSVR